VGIDFSDSMLDRARQAAAESGIGNLELRAGDAERLPLESASVDVVIINGIFNLNPARQAIFEELSRVVRANGRVYAAELVLNESLPQVECQDESNWFA